jgi:pyruvate kinase
MMNRVAKQSEAFLWSTGAWGDPSEPLESVKAWNTVASATASMSKKLDARAVIVVSQTGISAQIISSARPAAPIIALTGNVQVFRKMSLLWGVIPLFDEAAGTANPNELARKVSQHLGLAETGQHILLVRGFHNEPAMNLPSVTVITL